MRLPFSPISFILMQDPPLITATEEQCCKTAGHLVTFKHLFYGFSTKHVKNKPIYCDFSSSSG